ncbi:MAG: acetate--CoA ligase [Nanoarchaeota archaeon]|nr:acetate--CoA ligase [Nanoarchaeota archaeon]MBU1623200.1 acetate--CoA ligase [Nanoarchaeota archaeon]MBU1974212.1 acetate--CoA ligase [Nanoarchaeota archaeon]
MKKLKRKDRTRAKVSKKFNWKTHHDELAWFKGEKINAAYNAVTRHALSDHANKPALYWENDRGKAKTLTFSELEKLSNKFANVLKKLQIKKGERVFIFLPKVPETYISFLGILKTGAIAGTLFQAFGYAALEDRLKNSGAKYLITSSELVGRVDKVKKNLPKLKKIILIDKIKVKKNEISYSKEMAKASDEFKVKPMKPEDPAFMLYTSGTTGKPKGVIHKHGAILQQHLTAKKVLDLKENDIYWCTADPGWVTGIAYGILGNWSNGVSSLVYEGKFSPDKWYSLIKKYKVKVWYTAPTAIRMLMRSGVKLPKKYNLKSLRYLCSVGEPLNPEAIRWGRKAFGLSFHDTWWQTETGAICIANQPTLKMKVGSMGKPFLGVKAAVLNDKGKEVLNHAGDLVLKPGWPSMMKEIWRNEKKYKSYFKKGWYYSGDKALQDQEGYFWFIGRADDIIKTRGERVGPFEVESALIEHPGIAEAAVIGKPDALLGEIIKAFVVLAKDYKPSKNFTEEIKKFVKKRLAGHAYPKEIEIRKDLPKTRSGKIVRRFLKAQELGLTMGDTSTLEKE